MDLKSREENTFMDMSSDCNQSNIESDPFDCRSNEFTIPIDHYEEYIEVDGYIVNKADWERTSEEEQHCKTSKHFVNAITYSSREKEWDFSRSTTNWFHCRYCTHTARCRSAVRKHVAIEHAALLKKYESKKRYSCHICDFTTSSKNSLHLHRTVRRHAKVDPCDYSPCSECQKLEDSGGQCEQCDYHVKSLVRMHAHMKLAYEFTEYQCGKCNFVMNIKSKLPKQHLDGNTSLEKVNECTDEPQSFLKIHMNSEQTPVEQIQNF